MELTQTIALKFILALVIGGIIGIERELRSKSAGFRTLILICTGATMFTIMSQYIGGAGNPDRIASNVVVGIGFLGAGVIYRGDKGVSGITTAASIWLTAAMGMAIGCGYYIIAIFGCISVVTVLFLFSFLDNTLDKLNQVREYKIVYAYEISQHHKYEELFKLYGLSIRGRTKSKTGNMITGRWTVTGKEQKHYAFIEYMLLDGSITEFDF